MGSKVYLSKYGRSSAKSHHPQESHPALLMPTLSFPPLAYIAAIWSISRRLKSKNRPWAVDRKSLVSDDQAMTVNVQDSKTCHLCSRTQTPARSFGRASLCRDQKLGHCADRVVGLDCRCRVWHPAVSDIPAMAVVACLCEPDLLQCAPVMVIYLWRYLRAGPLTCLRWTYRSQAPSCSSG